MGKAFTDWQREWPPERLSKRSSCEKVEYLSVDRPVYFIGQGQEEPLNPRTIIAFDDLCLVEAIEEPDIWWMGLLDTDGAVRTWGHYGDLENVIDAL
jgi:hypothetical protein